MDGLYVGGNALKYLWSKIEETFGKPAGEDIVYTDTVTGTKYQMSVEGGVITFTEVISGKVVGEDVVYTDTQTGATYRFGVENGLITLTEK